MGILTIFHGNICFHRERDLHTGFRTWPILQNLRKFGGKLESYSGAFLWKMSDRHLFSTRLPRIFLKY